MSCDCCSTPAAAVPAEIANRPGLSAVAYRIGTFATFRKAILDQLAGTPELAGLTARVADDYTLTAVELWAAVADVLTFYQERIANEAFLGTATLRDSVLRLVRLLGYELRPGAAATTRLAFTLEAGAVALIPAGTRVQSIPGEGEKPQKFETLANLTADARLNKLRLFPAPVKAEPTGAGSASAIVAPDAEALANAAKLAPGDRVMLYAPNAIEVLTVSEVQARDDLLTLRWALPIKGAELADAFDASDPARRAYKLGRSFHLFGFDAPPTAVVPQQSTPGNPATTYLTVADTDYSLQGDGTAADQLSLDGRYKGLEPGAALLGVATLATRTVTVPLTVYATAQKHVERKATPSGGTPVVVKSGTVTQLSLLILGTAVPANFVTDKVDVRGVVLYELLGAPLRFWPYSHAGTVAANEVFLPGRRAGWSSVEVGRTIDKGRAKPGTVLEVSDLAAGRTVLLTDAKGGTPVAATIADASIFGSGVSFAPTEEDAVTVGRLGLGPGQTAPVTVLVSRPLGSEVVLPNRRRELTVTIGSLPPQTLSLATASAGSGSIFDVAAALQTAIRAALPGAPAFARALAWKIGSNAIAVAPGIPGECIAFGPSAHDGETVAGLGLDAAAVRFLDGELSTPVALPIAINGMVRMTIGADQPVDEEITVAANTAGELADAVARAFVVNAQETADDRILVLPPLPAHEPRVYLRLALDLEAPVALDAATAVLLGNVAPASHGETVRDEVLGDGDASQPFQRFTLRKKPVTHVPAAVPGGVQSSLQLLVNGVRWTERASLHGASPRDPIYVTRVADDGTLTVQFGDGVAGARPPSGRQNIVATYRQGIGLAGSVKAGQLSTLLDRPTGVKGVINPADADGGADPETMARAREAAPGTVRTFGRAVSLRDFEDTALLAGEVAKMSATWAWTGERRAIHLTVAGQDGAVFSPGGLARIAATLATERDPNHQLLIANYVPVGIVVDASLIVDDRYVASEVLAAARAALLGALSFAARRFAQPVHLSDVFRVLQDVPGVVAVDVNRLDLKSDGAAFRAAHGVDDALPQPQPRLLMLPARPAGIAGVVLPAELAVVEAPAQDLILRTSGGLSR